MSSNHYRSLVRAHQQRIARLRESHSRKIHEAAKHGEAVRKTAVEATRLSLLRPPKQSNSRLSGTTVCEPRRRQMLQKSSLILTAKWFASLPISSG